MPDVEREAPKGENTVSSGKRKNVRYISSAGDSRIKTIDFKVDPKNGFIEGYLAAYGNVDAGLERFLGTPFAKSISERIPAGKVPLMVKHWMYGGDVFEAVGIVTEGREDSYGLWIHADLDGSEVAQALRRKVLDGIAKNMSVGYHLVRWETVEEAGKMITNLLEGILLEGTVTVRPMNESAVILNAKTDSGLPPEAEARLKNIERALQELEAKITDEGAAATDARGTQKSADLLALRRSLQRQRLILERRTQ